MARFDMNLLGALDALLSECNVTRAAEKLNVTQSTMSGMLQRLRFQFDDQLLTRNGRLMELTPFARALQTPVREALRGVEALVHAEPIFEPKTSTRSFSIMASDYFTTLVLPKVLKRLSVEAPGVRVAVNSLAQPLQRLFSAEVDLCISSSDITQLSNEPDRLQSEYLFSDEFVCIVREDHPLGKGCTLEEYLSYPHIAIRFDGIPMSIESLALVKHAPHYQAPYSVTDFSRISCVVAESYIIGVVQRRLATLSARALPIRMFKPPFMIPDLDEAMIWHPRHIDDPAHCWLRAIFREITQEQFQGGEVRESENRRSSVIPLKPQEKVYHKEKDIRSWAPNARQQILHGLERVK